MSWITNPYRFGRPGPPGGVATTWGLRTISTAGDRFTLQEFEMASSVAGANICTGGTAGGSATNPAYAFDGNVSNYWEASEIVESNSLNLFYTFAAPVAVAEFRLTTRGTPNHPQAPRVFQSWWSNDGGTTKNLYKWHFASAWTDAATQTFSLTSGSDFVSVNGARAAARLWRARITARQGGGNQTHLAEMVIADTVSGAQLISSGFQCSSGNRTFSSGTGYDNTKLVDGTTNQWISHTETNHWCGGVFSTAHPSPAEFRLRGPSSADAASAPATLALQWSTDSDNWTTTDTYSGLAAWSDHEWRSFSIS